MKIRSYFLLLLFLCIFISCQKENGSIDLLRQAQTIVENRPLDALLLLDSIPNPENMDKDNRMQYIVTYVQAKHKMHHDVTNDTLIFEAQEYFDSRNNSQLAALAGYYSGIVNREIKRYNRSLKSFLKAEVNAKKIGNIKLTGRIFDYIGYVYLEQGMMDSAIANYHKAVDCYYQLKEKDDNIIRVTNQIGRAYEDICKLDSAYVYFNKALQMAEKQENKEYIGSTTLNLGLTSFGMHKYDEAIAYLKSAVNMESLTELEVIKTEELLLKCFNAKNDLNSAKEYAAKVESSLPLVSSMQIKKEMCVGLIDYYKQLGDYKQALHFSELESETISQIAEEERPVEMIKAETKFRAAEQDKVYEKLQTEFYVYLVGGIVLIIVILLLSIFTYKHNKKEKEEMRLQVEKYRRAREYLASTKGDYAKIEAQLKALSDDIEKDNENSQQ